MTEGWLSDTRLLDLETGQVSNVTAVDRVSAYNTGLFYLPGGKGFGFTPLIAGVSKPFVMDPDGKNKRDVSDRGAGFAYGYSASPDGKRISYHENYRIVISNLDGTDKTTVDTGNPFNFAPAWSPDGEWLLFVSGEHYDCQPAAAVRGAADVPTSRGCGRCGTRRACGSAGGRRGRTFSRTPRPRRCTSRR